MNLRFYFYGCDHKESDYQLAPQQPNDPNSHALDSGFTPDDVDKGWQPGSDNESACNHPDNWATGSFSDKDIRMAFIRNVYLILMVQLTFTVAMICLCLFCIPVKHWMWENSWFHYVSYYYDTKIVLICMGITAAVCLAISVFAIQTKIDFTACAGVIFAPSVVLLMFGFACLITYLVSGDEFANHVMSCVYGGLAALVFSLFLVFATHVVVGDKNRKVVLSPKEYISGALQLYLNILYLIFWLLIVLVKD